MFPVGSSSNSPIVSFANLLNQPEKPKQTQSADEKEGSPSMLPELQKSLDEWGLQRLPALEPPLLLSKKRQQELADAFKKITPTSGGAKDLARCTSELMIQEHREKFDAIRTIAASGLLKPELLEKMDADGLSRKLSEELKGFCIQGKEVDDWVQSLALDKKVESILALDKLRPGWGEARTLERCMNRVLIKGQENFGAVRTVLALGLTTPERLQEKDDPVTANAARAAVSRTLKGKLQAAGITEKEAEPLLSLAMDKQLKLIEALDTLREITEALDPALLSGSGSGSIVQNIACAAFLHGSRPWIDVVMALEPHKLFDVNRLMPCVKAGAELPGAGSKTILHQLADETPPVPDSSVNKYFLHERAALLIKLGADPLIKGDDGKDAIDAAAKNRNQYLLKALALSGIEPSLIDSGMIPAEVESFNFLEKDERQVPFLYSQPQACLRPPILKALAALNLCNVRYKGDSDDSNNGRNLLHFAETGEQVRAWKNAGFKLIATDGAGRTALHNAARNGNLEVAAALLDEGADLGGKDRLGLTPLHHAVQQEQLEVIQMLLDRGADINIRDERGQTPLHHAVQKKPQLISLLIEKGADVNAQDRSGRTALHYAAQAEDLLVARTLIEKNGDPRVADNDGNVPANIPDVERQTLLHRAAVKKNFDLMLKLIVPGADLNLKDGFGDTPLHYVAETGNVALAEHLIEQGADFDLQGKGMTTPLHRAVMSGNLEMVTLLINKEADVNAKDGDGETPVSHATRSNWQGIRDLLIANGAEIPKRKQGGGDSSDSESDSDDSHSAKRMRVA